MIKVTLELLAELVARRDPLRDYVTRLPRLRTKKDLSYWSSSLPSTSVDAKSMLSLCRLLCLSRSRNLVGSICYRVVAIVFGSNYHHSRGHHIATIMMIITITTPTTTTTELAKTKFGVAARHRPNYSSLSRSYELMMKMMLIWRNHDWVGQMLEPISGLLWSLSPALVFGSLVPIMETMRGPHTRPTS